ncbi:hypothetical protein AB6A40_006157 [Gnathostoma spinigerum]|uniref:inositol-polyphosphate 5-phosphatase n=1 Tax=Gnathostoma spinigerum TaxID=75299 RepID=A0ABD6EHK4_9BILA
MKKKFFFVTANVGSLFEESCRIHNGWLTTIVQEIENSKAVFVVIHMQEVGGKNYEECVQQVPGLVQNLQNELEKFGYSTGRAYMDLEYELEDSYTALGSLFFIHDSSLQLFEQYNFTSKQFLKLDEGFILMTKNLDNSEFLIKEKFPTHFCPAIVRWRRKGYLHCRFRYNSMQFDLVNVHLFHDESNIALIHENPSLYSDNRKRALNYVLEEASKLACGSQPLFVFGDLNFRLDPPSFLNRITEDGDLRLEAVDGYTSGNLIETAVNELSKKDDANLGDSLRRTVSAIEFRRSPYGSRTDLPSSCILRIEKKRFDYFNHKKLLSEWHVYLEDDKEAKNFPSLNELPICFPPTYPWSEDPDESKTFMKTRAPAWCDRILMNDPAYSLVTSDRKATYDSIGKEICMGDHKPVVLSFSIPG